MKSLLYYPYIDLPQNDWTIRALLYYDNVNAIVPTQYFYEPEHYSPFMREAIMNELITPINPMDVLNKPYEVSLRFIEYLSARKSVIERRRSYFSNQAHKIHRDKFLTPYKRCKLHSNKFDSNVFDYLMEIGLAERMDYNWYYQSDLYCNCTTHFTSLLFKILHDNSFNIKEKQFRQCNGKNIYTNEEPSFFKTVKWDEFMENHNYYIEKAIEIKNNKDAYDVHINLD